MLAKIRPLGPRVNLIPNTAIQFLDFGFNLNETRLSRAFLVETGADGRPMLTSLYADDASGQFTIRDGRTVRRSHGQTGAGLFTERRQGRCHP